MTARRFFLALIVAIATAAVPANAAERVVNFYNWSDYVAPTVFDAFTKETGIAVRYDSFDGNDTLEAKLFAGQSGYDVVVPTSYFLGRQIEAGLYRKLDKSKLPNLVHAWPEIADRLAAYDPGNQYAVNYMWGTTGIGYNVKAVRNILGPDAAIDSWDYIFDPEKIKKFKDCGIHFLDSSDDVMSAGLTYLHRDPNSRDPADLEKVTELLVKIRPYSVPIPLRRDFSAARLRGLAKKTKDGPQARRLLTLAAIYDGATRTEAAKIGGVGLQIIRDWVLRFNAQGPDGLLDRKPPGQPSKLNDGQRQAVAQMIESGPIPAVHGVVRWRLIDLAQWIYEEFRITIAKQTLSRELRAMGYRKLSARPRHHAQAAGAIENFKKTSPRVWTQSRARRRSTATR